MTYNVHSCVGMDGRRSPERIAAVIAAAAPDVVCLQELDVGRVRSGRVHQAQIIARALTMKFHFHPALEVAEEQYGDAILSRYPFELVKAGALPTASSWLPVEPRGAIWVSLACQGVEWQILNTHLGLGRAERRRQAAALAGPEWTGTALSQRAVVLCGDLNSRPRSEVHAILSARLSNAGGNRGTGGVGTEGARGATGARSPAKTFSTKVPFVCLDYIYLSPAVRSLATRVIDTPLARLASDHFPVTADLELAP